MQDAKKLNLFPDTFKDGALKWLMGLGTNFTRSWDAMKQHFLDKCKDYCIEHDIKEKFSKMSQKEDENIEDYIVERFVYNVKREKKHKLGFETLKNSFTSRN